MDSAKSGNGNFFMSGVSGCSTNCGNQFAGVAHPMFHMPSTNEVAGKYCSGASCDTQYLARSMHEYIHNFQIAAGGTSQLPSWLTEGGAVLLEAFFAQKGGYATSYS